MLPWLVIFLKLNNKSIYRASRDPDFGRTAHLDVQRVKTTLPPNNPSHPQRPPQTHVPRDHDPQFMQVGTPPLPSTKASKPGDQLARWSLQFPCMHPSIPFLFTAAFGQPSSRPSSARSNWRPRLRQDSVPSSGSKPYSVGVFAAP